MIKKMQTKFVLLSMGSFLLVLVIIIAAINIVNFNGIVRETDELLSFLSDNKGRFPVNPGFDDRLPPGMSPEIPYETRYFSVTFDNRTGTLIQADTSRIVSVDTTQAIAYANRVLESGKSHGFADTFRFCQKTEGIFLRITFLDCGRKLDAFYSFLFASAGITLVGYLIVFALIAFFSNRIIRPISESYEKQKRFITDAGHEIKTPLAIIQADTDVLAMELDENEWLEDIQKQTRRLATLTNDLVMLSRMEEGETAMSMESFSFSHTVQETALSFSALAQTQGKEFHCQIQPDLTFRGNEKAIAQLVSILLDNAIKYSPDHSTIRLTAEKQGKTLRLTVFNTTIAPIAQDSIPLLFDRFYRTDPSRNSQTGGHGIGLSIARAIVNAHNGKINAATEDGQSLQITAVFPV